MELADVRDSKSDANFLSFSFAVFRIICLEPCYINVL